MTASAMKPTLHFAEPMFVHSSPLLRPGRWRATTSFAIRHGRPHSNRRSLTLHGNACGNKRKDTPNPTHWHVTTFTLEVTKQQQLGISPSEIYVRNVWYEAGP